MATHPVNPHRVSMRIKGTMTFHREGDSTPRKWVYQNTTPGYANMSTIGQPRLQLRRHVIPNDPRAPAVLAHRAWFRLGMQTWFTLSPTQQQSYKSRADRMHRTPQAEFLSQWMQKFPPIIDAQLSAATQQADTISADASVF